MKFKIRVFTFAIFVLAAIAATAQEDVPDYTVQVGNYANPKPTDFGQLQSHGFVYTVKRPNHIDVFIGGYGSDAEAGKMLATLQLFGFSNSAVTKLNAEGGEPVTVIQLVTKRVGDKIKWEDYVPAGKLYVLLSGDHIKILAGTFPDVPAAKAHLTKLQQVGFKDAFVKNVNNVLLHEVSDFEMGGALKKPLIPLVFEEKKAEKAPEQPKPAAETDKPEVPKNYEVVATVPAEKSIIAGILELL